MAENSQPQSQADILLYEEKKGVAFITINRPEAKNSLNGDLLDKILALLKQISENRKIKVVVIKSVGEKVFSAGLDLKWVTSLGADALNIVYRKATAVSEAIMKCPKVVITQVQGAAVGWGTMVFLNSDFRVVADSPDVFFQLPEVDVGIPAATGATLLPVLHLGMDRAKRMLLLREKVGIEFMKDIITKIVPKEKLDEETEEFAKEIAKHPNNHLIQLTKSSINIMGQNIVSKFFELEKAVLDYAKSVEKPGIAEFNLELWKQFANFDQMKFN
jgi:enoyl-CoA hydratase